MHQAEESFEIDSYGIPLEKIAREIDILISDIALMGDMKEYREILTQMVDEESPLLDRTYIYTSRRDFDLQTNNKTDIFNFLKYLDSLGTERGAAE